MTNDRETWLSTIRSNPSDWQTMLVFADWLEEEDGDLLAAEQWRWIAAVAGTEWSNGDSARFCRKWPNIPPLPLLWPEEEVAKANNIRARRYPRTIEDVQAYLETAT